MSGTVNINIDNLMQGDLKMEETFK